MGRSTGSTSIVRDGPSSVPRRTRSGDLRCLFFIGPVWTGRGGLSLHSLDVPSQQEKAELFLRRHHEGEILLMPNAWDIGSARLFASMGFESVATTSSGFAATLGRLDGGISRDEALAHSAELVGGVEIPVSADLENCFADDPADVAVTIAGAIGAGLAGCSIEDFTGDRSDPIYDAGLARERVAAAAEAAHNGPVHLVLTARAENHIKGRDDIDDTIGRLQSFAEAGADVLFAPGLPSIDDVRRIVEAVERPVSVLANPSLPPVAELAGVGVRRISVGGSFAFAAFNAAAEAARELKDEGTYGYAAGTRKGIELVRQYFGS
jgi:2-methylisocitrate lyase-like PEP mutase family enzyme